MVSSPAPTQGKIDHEAVETHPFAEEACQVHLNHHSRESTRHGLRVFGQHPHTPLTYDEVMEKTGLNDRKTAVGLVRTLIELATAEPASCRFEIVKGTKRNPDTGRPVATFTFTPFTSERIQTLSETSATSTSQILARSQSNENVVEVSTDIYERIQEILRHKFKKKIPLMQAEEYPENADYIRQLVNGASWCFFTENGELEMLREMFEETIRRGAPLAFRMYHLKDVLRKSRYDGFIKQKLEPQVVSSTLKLGLGFCFIEGQFLAPYVVDPKRRRELLMQASTGKRGPIDHYFDPVLAFDYETAMQRIDQPSPSGKLALASLNERQINILRHTTTAFYEAINGTREHPMLTEELAETVNCSMSSIRADMKRLMGTRLQIGLHPRYRGDNCIEVAILDAQAPVVTNPRPANRRPALSPEMEERAKAARADIQAAAELQKRIQKAHRAIEAAERRLAELRGEIEAEEEKTSPRGSSQDTRLATLEQALMTSQDEAQRLQKRITERETSIQSLQAEITQLQAALAAAKEATVAPVLSPKQTAILEAYKTLRKIMNAIDRLEASLREKRAELNTVSRQLGTAKAQLEKTRREINGSNPSSGNDELFEKEAARIRGQIETNSVRYGIITSIKYQSARFNVPLYSIRVGSPAYQECVRRFKVPVGSDVGFYAYLEEDNTWQLLKLNPAQVKPKFLN